MKNHILPTALLLAITSAGSALAAQQTVHLAVDNMTCSTCPYTVKKALSQVPGVEEATTSYQKKTATVTFDDEKADLKDLTRATTNAGYPSRLLSEKSQEQEAQ